MSEKKYIGGSAKQVETQYGGILNLSLKLSDMQEIVNEKGYVNMSVMARKEPWQYGDTHYVCENDYKPKPKHEQDDVNLEDVPF